LYFPLRVSNPALIVEALKLDDIESFNWWQHMHGAVDWDLYPCARKMKQSIVALPVHQKLGSAQIKRIADTVKAAMNNQK
jgi:dTDP-4-amino-4,6-dideoxygalactose transaminase